MLLVLHLTRLNKCIMLLNKMERKEKHCLRILPNIIATNPIHQQAERHCLENKSFINKIRNKKEIHNEKVNGC